MRELGIRQVEAHVAAVCISRHAEPLQLLALHRAATRTLFPNLHEGPGGQVDIDESFPEAALRHIREEAGLVARIVQPVSTYVIEPGALSGSDKRIPGLRFLAVVDGLPDATIDSRQHSDWRWVSIEAYRALDAGGLL
jgi:8-oxo-dGTP pyrophosphatase MutT (NUDIX family)